MDVMNLWNYFAFLIDVMTYINNRHRYLDVHVYRQSSEWYITTLFLRVYSKIYLVISNEHLFWCEQKLAHSPGAINSQLFKQNANNALIFGVCVCVCEFVCVCVCVWCVWYQQSQEACQSIVGLRLFSSGNK